MALSSFIFLVFLAVCTAAHYLLPSRFRNFWLLICSVGFFVYAMPAEAVIMMVYVLVLYLLGMGLSRKKHGRALYLFGLLLSVGFLFVYKYTGFVYALFGAQRPFSLIVPIGISYVTFQGIAYLTEIHKGRLEPENNAVDFFLYALFFPKLTAGPIEPPKAFLAQLKGERRFSRQDAVQASLRIAMGMIKKLVLADYLALGVNAVFDSSGAAGGWSVLIAAFMYTAQIYFDFSGYTDIARGAAQLLGIRLTENFHQPYRAVSIRDFWSRWHISLSTWLKDYIYIPLGGSRVGTFRRYLNLLITFLVSGIWHGADLTFVVWGLLHGLFQIFGKLTEPLGRKLRKALSLRENSLLAVYFCRARTFLLVTLGWVFFRAASLDSAVTMLSRLFAGWGSLSEALQLCGVTVPAVLLVFAYAAVKLLGRELAAVSGRDGAPGRTGISGRPGRLLTVLVLAAWAVVLMTLVIAARGGGSAFIYFDF